MKPDAPAPAIVEPRWIVRLGLAVAQPRWALAIANDRRHAGRSGTDLVWLIGIVILATQLRGLFTAAWLGYAVDTMLGVRAAIQLLTRALTLDLGFLVVGALAIWGLAGAKRDLGRAFDLACVAAIPLLLVELAAATVVRAFELPLPPLAGWVLRGISWAWAGALLALAWRVARVASKVPAIPDEAVARLGKRAGLGVLVLALVGLAVQTLWVVRNVDSIRPVQIGDSAPAIALPTIEASGASGPVVSPERGKVTVVEFWATWCTPCKQALPKLDALVRKYPGTVGLAINLDDSELARAHFDERQYRHMKLLADDMATSERYGVSTIPHIVVIDGNGFVRLVTRGSTSNVEAAIVSALEGR